MCPPQAATIKPLMASNLATRYDFLVDPQGSYILGYIVISDLKRASGKRRSLLQDGTTATVGIPVPAGLTAAEGAALESGLQSAAASIAQAVAADLGLMASGVQASVETVPDPAPPEGEASEGDTGLTALYASLGVGAVVAVVVFAYIVVKRRRNKREAQGSELTAIPPNDQVTILANDDPPTLWVSYAKQGLTYDIDRSRMVLTSANRVRTIS